VCVFDVFEDIVLDDIVFDNLGLVFDVFDVIADCVRQV